MAHLPPNCEPASAAGIGDCATKSCGGPYPRSGAPLCGGRGPEPLLSPGTALPEPSNAGRLFRDHARIVQLWSAGRLALDQHFWAGPHRKARAPVAARLIAHDIAPFGAIDVAMAIGKWHHVSIDAEIVTCPDNVANLGRHRV